MRLRVGFFCARDVFFEEREWSSALYPKLVDQKDRRSDYAHGRAGNAVSRDDVCSRVRSHTRLEACDVLHTSTRGELRPRQLADAFLFCEQGVVECIEPPLMGSALTGFCGTSGVGVR